MLLTFALLSDTGILLIATHLLGTRQPTLPPPTERRMHVPHAADTALWQPLHSWGIRGLGRTRLFESYCREAVAEISGEECFEERDPVAVVVSWMLDAEADSLGWDAYPFLRCEDADLRAVLYAEEDNPSRMTRPEQLHGRYVEPVAARSCRALHEILRGAASKQSRLSSLEQAALALQRRLSRWQRIRAGEVEDGSGVEKLTVSAALRQAYQSGDKELFATALNDFHEESRRALGVEGDASVQHRLAAEAWLNQRAPERKALTLSLLAMVCLAAAALVKSRRPKWHRILFRGGVFAACACLAWSTAALVAHSIQDNALLASGEQGMFYFAAATMGLGFVLALLHRERICARCATVASSVGFFLAQRGSSWPLTIDCDTCLRVQRLLLLSGFAALTLAWSVALVAAGKLLVVAPNGERLRRLAALCVSALRVGIALLVGNALVKGLRVLGMGHLWRGGNVQELAPLFVLPACFALLYARRRGWMPPFAVVMSVGVAFPLLILAMYGADRAETWRHLSTADAWIYGAGLVNFSLLLHAALRYYYGRQRVFDA